VRAAVMLATAARALVAVRFLCVAWNSGRPSDMFAFAVITGLVAYVVPQIVGVFAHSKQSLPLLTQALILVSDVMRASGIWLALGAAGAVMLVRRALRNEALRLRWHARLLAAPLLGRFLRTVDSARFASTMAILVGSGVPIVNALGYAGAALDDEVFRRATAEAAARVREGQSISRSLKQSGVFPGMLLHLVASGEASGELARVLEQAARQQELSAEARLSALTAVLEPLLILVMGAVVLVIVLVSTGLGLLGPYLMGLAIDAYISKADLSGLAHLLGFRRDSKGSENLA